MNELKKVLFITYYWPPAGGAAIERILKFYKYLPEFGWEPIILTVDKGDFPFVDEDLISEIRENTIVYRSDNFSLHKVFSIFSKEKSEESLKPFAFTDTNQKGFKAKLSRWVKFNAIPDTRFLWKYYAIKKAKQICKEHKIDLIFSSSPPQTNHIIATKVSKATGIPCVGDFRDPWTDVYWLKTFPLRWKLIHYFDKKLEKRTLDRMTAITTVSPSWVELFQSKTKSPVHLVYNGFDNEINISNKTQNSKFTIRYTGSLSLEQDISVFMKALDLLDAKLDLKQNFNIEFIGNFPEFVKDKISSFKTAHQVKILPYVSSKEAYDLMNASDMLLLFIHLTPDNGVINYKIYDYLSTAKTILAFGDKNGDAAQIIEKSRAGKMFEYSDDKSVATFIEEKFLEFKEKEFKNSINVEFVSSFKRKVLCKRISEIFNDIIV